MSAVTSKEKSEIWQILLIQRPESSTKNIYEISSGLRIKVQRSSGTVGSRHMSIEIVGANNRRVQCANFSMNGSRTFEVLINKDVQKIPVILYANKSKTFEWRAPFAKFPICVEACGNDCKILIDQSGISEVDVSNVHKDASDSKEGTKKDEADSSAESTSASSKGASSANTEARDSSKESLQSSASSN